MKFIPKHLVHMTKKELQAKYEELHGESPKPQWSKPELEERINNADAENQISAKAEDAWQPGAEAGARPWEIEESRPGTGEITGVKVDSFIDEEKVKQAPEVDLKKEFENSETFTADIETVGYSDVSDDDIDGTLQQEINKARKVKDGKRHLVYKDGQEVWWTPSVIEVMYASFGPERIKFPENSEYILKNPKRCSTCG